MLPTGLFLAALSALAPSEAKVSPGKPMPEVELGTVLGGDGRKKLSEFRGQPVLIVWYSSVFAGIDGARAAADLAEDAAGLAVLLMEIKSHDATYLRALQMAELPGVDFALFRNQPLPVVFDDTTGFPPKMVLVGVDGTLLYAGSYQRASTVKKLIEAEMEKREKGWGEDPLAREARALGYGRGKLGEARALLEPQLGGGSAEVASLAAELEARFGALERSIAYYLEQGEPRRASAAARELAAAAAGTAAWVERAEKAAALPASATREAELEKKLDALLKPTLKDKPKKGLDAKLAAFAQGDAKGTQVGARAARLAEAVARSFDEL